jgi:3-phenylpropionate/trans-cinnamate dioxygenase ferredoxin reductase subunit
VPEPSERSVEYLLIGGGLACANCARWLREEGADGGILIVGREPDPPYNRPECSKGYLRGEETREDAYFRPDEWWDEQDVEMLLRTSVTGLDLDGRIATLSNGDAVRFDKALLATGANVRRLSVPGCELEGIHYLRSFGNADTIREQARGIAEREGEVVLVGGSFIACEVAASLTTMGCQCTLVMLEQWTLERAFGLSVGRFIQESLEARGVRIHGGENLDRFEGSGGVERVVTESGLELAADMVVVGVGVAPEIGLAKKAGLEIGERGGVLCSTRLETSVPGVYAAGDMCEYESVIHEGQMLRVEHWDVAFNQGRTVGLNMLGRDIPHEVVPYFYSVLSDVGELEYVGPAYGWDEEVLRGSFDGTFTNWYLEDGRVRAALAWGRSDDLEAARRLIASGVALDERQRGQLAAAEVALETIGA